MAIRKFIFMILMLFSMAAYSQVAYKGQINVSDVDLSVQGTMLRVKMRVSYGKNLINRGETLNFTPVLKDAFYQQSLSSVVITGKGQQVDLQRGNFPVVRKNGKEKTYSFDYDTTVPFSGWMRSASMYIESEERSSKGKGHTYEDLVFEYLTIKGGEETVEVPAAETAPVKANKVSRTISPLAPKFAKIDWIQILDPSERKTDETVFTGLIPLADSRHIGSMGTAGFNKTVLEEILTDLGDELTIPGTTVASIHVTGYGAPIGDLRQNELRCTARAYELKRYLQSGKKVIANQVNVSWVTEDWDSITTLIDNSELRFRNAALDVIRNVDVVSGREAQLQMLGNGSLYKDLQNEVFPRVCRLTYEVVLRRENTAGVVPSSRSVQLNEMYATAQHFQKGSDDFNDLMDLTARLFPTSADACINAAGVALLRGQTERAENYLRGHEADPRAYNNIGVLCLLKGDMAKAETYLRMASKLGVPEANEAMKELPPDNE